jgi:hypothetical protein
VEDSNFTSNILNVLRIVYYQQLWPKILAIVNIDIL